MEIENEAKLDHTTDHTKFSATDLDLTRKERKEAENKHAK